MEVTSWFGSSVYFLTLKGLAWRRIAEVFVSARGLPESTLGII